MKQNEKKTTTIKKEPERNNVRSGGRETRGKSRKGVRRERGHIQREPEEMNKRGSYYGSAGVR